MTTAPPPPAPKAKPAAPPPPSPQQQVQAAKPETNRVRNVSSGVQIKPQRFVFYGPGGVGKTKLVSLAKHIGLRVLVIDLENRSHHVDVNRVDDVSDWADLRATLQDKSLTSRFDLICVDSLTRAEDMSAAWIPYNIKNTKTGKLPETKSLDGYGYGSGAAYNYDNFNLLLGDLDALIRDGKHVAATCHECVASVPNPTGEDYLRYEPRLQCPSGGKNSIRHKVRDWTDHMFMVDFDVFVSEGERKGKGSGTRTIYPTQTAALWAKSHLMFEPMQYHDDDPTFWNNLLATKET